MKMDIFKKKKKPKEQSAQSTFNPMSMTMTPEELLVSFTEEAIREAYEKEQIHYKETQDPKVQQILVAFSKVMTDRAYQQGNGEVKKFFLKKGYDISEEDWNGFSREQKQKMAEMKQKMEGVDKEFQSITKPQPEKIEIEIKQPEPIEVNNKQQEEIMETIKKATIEERVNEEVEKRVQEELKRKNMVLLEDIDIVNAKEHESKPEQKHSTLQVDELFQEPKKKKGLGSLFKKKIPKQQTSPSSVEQIIKSGVTEEQKERAVKMEQATKKHSAEEILKKVFTKPDKEKKPKLSLPDIYCPDCTHPLKTHQSKGVSVGCRCGCLNTIEIIAEKHGVQLYSPKQVLDKISKENPEPKYAEMPNLSNPSLPDDSIIEQQAKALQSLKSKPIEPDTLASVFKKKEEPLHEGLCANCDHIPKTHFDNTGFCTVIGCKCENYRSYPQ